jgi:hypothetical protein
VQINFFKNSYLVQIFLFLWWWFVMVALVTTVNMLYWITTTASHSRRLSFVERYLRIPSDAQSRSVLNKFADVGLRPDGILVLRMLASHAGDLIATEIINKLWDNFRDESAKKEKEKEEKLLISEKLNRPFLDYDPNDFHPHANSIGFIETLYDDPKLSLPIVINSTPKEPNGVTHRNGTVSTEEEREQLISRPQHTTSNV